jgi:hypothetical protein
MIHYQPVYHNGIDIAIPYSMSPVLREDEEPLRSLRKHAHDFFGIPTSRPAFRRANSMPVYLDQGEFHPFSQHRQYSVRSVPSPPLLRKGLN